MHGPKWITPSGSLATIQELTYFVFDLDAQDSVDNIEDLTFTVISGSLPAGLSLRGYTLEGITSPNLRGIADEVITIVTSSFVVRVSNSLGRIADRTFSITVEGPDIPIWQTSAGSLGSTLDGEYFSTQIIATDSDGERVRYKIESGSLPPGLTLDEDGFIQGRIPVQPTSQEYNFVVSASDGNTKQNRTFSIYVYALDELTADSEIVSVDLDDGTWTADRYRIQRPYILDNTVTTRSFRYDNMYIQKILGSVENNSVNNISFEISGDYPSEVTFNGTHDTNPLDDGVASCVLSGLLPASSVSSSVYTFMVRPYVVWTATEYDPDVILTINGDWVTFTLTLEGTQNEEVVWS